MDRDEHALATSMAFVEEQKKKIDKLQDRNSVLENQNKELRKIVSEQNELIGHMRIAKKLIKLPHEGKLMVITDIHGNYDDYMRYIDIWQEKDCHILFLGDLIHGDVFTEDKSLDILNDVAKRINDTKFHILVGNHEMAQVHHQKVFRYGVSQTDQFNRLIEQNHSNVGDMITYQMMYEQLMQSFDYFATSKYFFFSHAGPFEHPDGWKSLSNNHNFESMFWSRPYDDYTEEDIDAWCDAVGCKFMVVGHTPYNGYHIYGNQLIFDSSHSTDTKYYLEIDLGKEYDSIIDVAKCLVLLE